MSFASIVLFDLGFTWMTSPIPLDTDIIGFVPISMLGKRAPFFFKVLLTALFEFSSMETARKRIASPMIATTKRPPPIAAPIIVPAPVLLGAETVIDAIRGFGVLESVGPGVSVGVIDGDAPIRKDGVGLGVSVGVMEDVTEIVGEGV